MLQQNIDGLIAFGERDASGTPQFSPDVYLTGERAGATVIFPLDGNPISHVWGPNSVTDHMEAVRRGEESWLNPDQFRLGLHSARLAETIRELGLAGAKIGVFGLEPSGPFYPVGWVPYGIYAGLQAELPDTTFVPVWEPFLKIMLSMSDEELQFVEHSARAGEDMCAAAIDVVRPGATEADIYAAVVAACMAHGAHNWWNIIVSGKDSIGWGPPRHQYRPGPPRTIESGDMVMLELFPSYGHYETQQQLTIAVGDVRPDTLKAAAVAIQSYEAGLTLLRPGVKFGDVVEAINRPQQDAGGWNLTPNVHTLPNVAIGEYGPAVRIDDLAEYPGIARNPSVRPQLEVGEGMVFALQPNCVIGRQRVNVGGTVVVTKAGCRELNFLAKELHHV
ncbi:M24 family metallopeptidase [Sphingobium subterraneum]|uniref:Xaa-Pro aminopeptidase n=1 Tax=Sphingobium subterraneum TaxID=627688 RepID=A0A841IXN0_9SPHN|nr:M24 family metallopeptidase [Sphingobium subterraneum]MBB6123050.1 Xaa-Pro aminopeptidase [Sphingobium subterraneum]